MTASTSLSSSSLAALRFEVEAFADFAVVLGALAAP
jgi:hypothetical protein